MAKYISVSIQVEPHDWENIKKIAAKEKSSNNQQARKALSEYVTKYFLEKGLV